MIIAIYWFKKICRSEAPDVLRQGLKSLWFPVLLPLAFALRWFSVKKLHQNMDKALYAAKDREMRVSAEIREEGGSSQALQLMTRDWFACSILRIVVSTAVSKGELPWKGLRASLGLDVQLSQFFWCVLQSSSCTLSSLSILQSLAPHFFLLILYWKVGWTQTLTVRFKSFLDKNASLQISLQETFVCLCWEECETCELLLLQGLILIYRKCWFCFTREGWHTANVKFT